MYICCSSSLFSLSLVSYIFFPPPHSPMISLLSSLPHLTLPPPHIHTHILAGHLYLHTYIHTYVLVYVLRASRCQTHLPSPPSLLLCWDRAPAVLFQLLQVFKLGVQPLHLKVDHVPEGQEVVQLNRLGCMNVLG